MIDRRVPMYYPTWFLPPSSPLECARAVREAGFDSVSFLAADADDPRRLDRLTADEAAALRRGLLEMGLGRCLHVCTGAYLELPDSEGLTVLKDHVEAAVSALSGPGLPGVTVTVDPPVRFGGRSARIDHDAAGELVGFLAGLAQRHGARVGIENWPFRCVATPEALRDLLWPARGRVGVLFDLGHAHIALSRGWCGQRDVAEFVRALPAPIVEMHLHDNAGRRDEHRMPGEGTADVANALAALREVGFRGPVTLECDLAAEGRPGLAEGLAAVRRTLEA